MQPLPGSFFLRRKSSRSDRLSSFPSETALEYLPTRMGEGAKGRDISVPRSDDQNGFDSISRGKLSTPPRESWNLEAEQLRVGTIASKLLKLLDRGKSFRKQFSNSAQLPPYFPTCGDKPQRLENVSQRLLYRDRCNAAILTVPGGRRAKLRTFFLFLFSMEFDSKRSFNFEQFNSAN